MQPPEPGSSVRSAMSAARMPPEGCSPEECSCSVQGTEVYCTNLALSPGAQVLNLTLADGEQGLGMSQRQVRPLLRGFLTPSLQDQAAAGLLDLHIRAAVWLVGKVALK